MAALRKLPPSAIAALKTWVDLNTFIVDVQDEDLCWAMLTEEGKRDKPRGLILLRIHSRLNRIRADRERKALMLLVKEPPASKGMRRRGA